MSSESQVSKRVEARREDPLANMIFVPGGEFRMGSDRHYAEEAPVHRVSVGAFWIDRAPVTNTASSGEFVNATNHVTFRRGSRRDPKDYPGALPQMLKAGSLVFTPPHAPVNLNDWSQNGGASSSRRLGEGRLWRPRSSISGLDDHLCRAYRLSRCTGTPIKRAGRARNCRPRPEWEFAARGGLDELRIRVGRRIRARRKTKWPTPGKGRFSA